MLGTAIRRTIGLVPPRHNRAGEETRNAIMLVVRQRAHAGLPPATVRGIARELCRDPSGIARHLSILVEMAELEKVTVAEGVVVFRLPTPPE